MMEDVAELTSHSAEASSTFPWVEGKDEELLDLRICELGTAIVGSELEPRVDSLYEELSAHGIKLRPLCYLSDEWFTPVGLPVIAVPFYLAHPRLKALELHQMLEVEGGTPEWCAQLLRHECGHAFDHAYRFSSRRKWRQLFGHPDKESTPESYQPRPYSKSYVQHLSNWYAQAHPDEDFAETFAVYLGMPESDWRKRYRGWKAIEKLEYVAELIDEASRKQPAFTTGKPVSEARRSKKTLRRYYAERRRASAEEYPDFYDADLRKIFGRGEPGEESAAHLLRRLRRDLLAAIVRGTGQRKYTVDMLLRKFILRCESLGLRASKDESRLLLDLSAYLAALVTNHLHTGRFKRSV